MASAVQLHGLAPKIVKRKLNTIDTSHILPKAAAVTRKPLKECTKQSGSDLGGSSSNDLNASRKACVSVATLLATVGLLVGESHVLAAGSWLYIHLRPCGGHVWPGSSIHMSFPPADSSSFDSFSFRAIAFFWIYTHISHLSHHLIFYRVSSYRYPFQSTQINPKSSSAGGLFVCRNSTGIFLNGHQNHPANTCPEAHSATNQIHWETECPRPTDS